MAGDWIKIEHWTPDKPEVFRMAELLDMDPDAVTGKLIRIWIWADQQTITGDAHSVTRASLDRLTQRHGFADAMLTCGWLEQTDDGLRFVNFDRHNGETAKTRALNAKRNGKLRARRHERDAGSVTSASPREEKRREDISLPNGRDNAPAKTQPRFTKPTIEEVELLGTGINAQEFWDFYEANGWKVGQNAMKDWRAAARNWKRRQGQFANGSHQRKPPPTSQQQFANYTPNSQPEVPKDQQGEVPF